MLALEELDKKVDEYALTCHKPSPQFIENVKCNARKIIGSLGDIELTDHEIRTLIWLSTWEYETINNMVSIIKKVALKTR